MIRSACFPAWRFAVAVLLLHLTSPAVTDVLPYHDSGPLTGIFGLPGSTGGGQVVARGDHSWDTSFIIASHSIDETSGDEVFRLDGETSRLAFAYRYGLTDTLNVGIEVPYVWHQSGSLDSLIDGWHDFFGFPDGPRAIRAQDQLEFFYSDAQGTLINMNSNVDGVGDVRLTAAWQLSNTDGRSTALRLGIKVPTGSADELLGSGGGDISLTLASDYHGLWGKSKLSGFYRAGLTFLGRPDQLADRHNDFAGQLSVGLGYRAHRNVDVRIQSRIRTAIYDSSIENLGSTSVSLVFGTDLRLSDRYRLALSVAEDVRVDSAPDVSFQVALRYAAE